MLCIFPAEIPYINSSVYSIQRVCFFAPRRSSKWHRDRKINQHISASGRTQIPSNCATSDIFIGNFTTSSPSGISGRFRSTVSATRDVNGTSAAWWKPSTRDQRFLEKREASDVERCLFLLWEIPESISRNQLHTWNGKAGVFSPRWV